MTEKIKAVLVEWAEMVLKNQAHWDMDDIHKAIQKLYEISIFQKFLTEESSNSERWKRHQAELSAVLDTLTGPRTNFTEKKEDLEVPPMMETIKNMVTEMPEPENYERLFDSVEKPPVFVPKAPKTAEKDDKPEQSIVEAEERKNLNDHFAKSLSIDLNDRMAFIKHLFQDNIKSYEAVISQIVTFEQWHEVEDFLGGKVKIEYPHWEEKKPIEERFLAILKNSFKS